MDSNTKKKECKYYDLDENGNPNYMWCLDPLLGDIPRPPIPLFKIKCPICGEEDRVYIKHFYIFKQFDSNDPTRNPYRCDVAIKCLRCKHIMVFGLHLPKEIYDKTMFKERVIKWTVFGHVKVKSL